MNTSARPPASDGHRTINRVTQIVEVVVARPGITFGELVRTLGAAKSSVHGFVQGLLARGWIYETGGGFYLGPAVYALSMASGHIRAGVVTYDDLHALHEATGVAAFLGVRAGDNLIYVAEAGSDPVTGFEAQTSIRRTLLQTAGGKALLAAMPRAEVNEFLRRRSEDEGEFVSKFLSEYPDIVATGIAHNTRQQGARSAIATVVYDRNNDATGAITLVGPTAQLQPRRAELAQILKEHVAPMQQRKIASREAI
ncbi:IclR family transcriptional regulator [Antarctobacter sp.]|uniref:IclR family transcriptional regulator n=1 Tax=Antarctobacter sp. TaxID=1872577 RepID=UPI003A923B0E